MAIHRLKKDHSKEQRLSDIEINEISLVDKPAIGENFIITKRIQGNKGGVVAKKKGKKTRLTQIKTVKQITKGVLWRKAFKKDEKGCDHGEECGFCGITKEVEQETIGMGLRCGVCFKCAVLHIEKDVVLDCLTDKFTFGRFAKKYPDIVLFKDADDEDDEDEDDEDEDEDDDGADDAGDDADDDKVTKGKVTSKRFKKMEKQVADVVELLAESMTFHEQTIEMINQTAVIIMSALELLVTSDQDASASDQTVEQATELKLEIKAYKKAVQKAGAKISASRMSALEEIATKLASLIASVTSDKKSDGERKGSKKSQKSVPSDLEILKKKMGSLEKSISDKDAKLIDMADQLDEIKAFGGSSSVIDEDDDDESGDSGTSKSVFADLIPLVEFSKRFRENY